MISGKDLNKSGTSFTFSLTNAERNTLRNACSNANSMTVKFYVKTIISGTTYWSSAIDKTFSIINANPTVSVSVVDNGSESTRLTGDSSVMIKGYNNVDASMTATALKGATIKSYKIVNGSNTVNAASGSFHYTENPTFVFTATDSRGNTASKTITMPMVEYVKLTCGLSAGMTVDGVVSATISGKCFKGSFGAYTNEIVVKYRYKISTGDYGDWTDAVAIFNGENYNASVSISGLDYRSKYVIQAKIIDSINSQTSVEKTLSCIPVFDWSEEDFNFNVPVSIHGNQVIKGDASTGSTLIGATPVNTTDNGICLRPNGVDTAEGQVFINGNGRVRINGDLKIGDEVMADFIVASGSSGIYAYRKWSSGRLELWGRVNLSPTSSTGGDARGNVYYCKYNASNDTTFPFTFVDKPYVQATVSSTSTYLTLAYVGCTNSKISTFYCTRGNNDFYATAVDVYLMGRWK